MRNENAALHDAYAGTYDADVQAYDCYIADLLFGLAFESVRPGESLLDVGTGTGLSAQPFAKAGLRVSGMDFSLAMLALCRAKGFAADLKQHDVQDVPWPYESGQFHHVASCGVFHFVADLAGIFAEVERVLKDDGTFAFTTRAPVSAESSERLYDLKQDGDFEIFSHSLAYVESLLAQHALVRHKMQRCYVGEDLFWLWVAQRSGHGRQKPPTPGPQSAYGGRQPDGLDSPPT